MAIDAARTSTKPSSASPAPSSAGVGSRPTRSCAPRVLFAAELGHHLTSVVAYLDEHRGQFGSSRSAGSFQQPSPQADAPEPCRTASPGAAHPGGSHGYRAAAQYRLMELGSLPSGQRLGIMAACRSPRHVSHVDRSGAATAGGLRDLSNRD